MLGITLHKLATPGSYTARRTFWVGLLAMALVVLLNELTPRDVRLHLLYVFPLGTIALHCASWRYVAAALLFAVACQVITSLLLGLAFHATLVDALVFAAIGACVVSFGRAGRKSHLQVLQMASFDALTGLLNRRSFETALQAEINRQKRYGGSFSLAVLDLDKFKQLNDSQGHQGGDTALQRVASLLQGGSRNTDTVFRLGGDEFAILMPHTGKDDGVTHCESLRKAIRVNMLAAGFDVSASMGVASFAEAPASLDAAVQLADTAMYLAKAQPGSDGAVASA
jgi:diguanylate cyclase (GGDEF)-like protein